MPSEPSPSSGEPASDAAAAEAGNTAAAGSVAGARSIAPLQAHGLRVPDFFIVGHQKCGTSALYQMLRRHPQIFMPRLKEPMFFAPELTGVIGRHRLNLDEYLHLFDAVRPGQLAGEASPQYLRTPSAARAIADLQPAARIIIILREPTSFLRSLHMQMLDGGVETQRDFRKAMALEGARRQGKRLPRGCRAPRSLLYSDHVRYVEQLRRYNDAFSPEQVLVLIYDDFRSDNEATVRRVLRFLDVDATLPIETVETQPLRRGVRSPLLNRLALLARVARRRPEAATPLGRFVYAITPRPLHSDAFRARWRRVVYRDARPPDEQFMIELRRRFKPQVVAVSDYLGRDLVNEWGY